MKLAIVSGTSIERSQVFEGWKLIELKTPFGPVKALAEGADRLVINRHGFESPLPPHKANYRAYVHAISEWKADHVLTLSSVGSLQPEFEPGAFVSCSDYVSFAPMTFIDDRPSGFAPRLDNALLGRIVEASPFPIATGRVYAQTRGPRFETRAEVKILQRLGCDVVGMTFANEADLLLERGLSVTSLCMVDNLAHGLGREELTMEEFRERVLENQSRVDVALSSFLDCL